MPTEIEAQAIKLVEDYWCTAHAKGVRVIDRVPEFLGGYLYIVEVTDANDEDHENLVLLKSGVLRRFDNLRDLAGTVPKLSLSERMLEPTFLIPAISGVIALVIVATICFLAVSDPKSKMPDALASSLTLVLGFYFGATTARAAKDKTVVAGT